MSRTRIPLSQAEEASKSLKQRLEMSTAEIGLTVRTTNCLEERGIVGVFVHDGDDLIQQNRFGLRQ